MSPVKYQKFTLTGINSKYLLKFGDIFFKYLQILLSIWVLFKDMNKQCKTCGESILGRSDKKFCSDQCRTSYNNLQYRSENNYVRKINRVLKNNRRILSELNPHGKTKTHLNELTTAGFNFEFFTSIYKTKTGNTYYFCYEHGYLALENNFYALVVRNRK